MPYGGNWAFKPNLTESKLDFILPYSHSIAAKAAIAKAPSWIKPELGHVLGQLIPAIQDKISQVINDAQHPYIDEICYSVAYSTPQYLSSQYCNPKLFLDNAMIMYENDKFINYAQIVDYGIAGVDPGYYSTVKYLRSDTLGNITEYEIPMDVYYLYIVHPKITDEIQAYIDPQTFEHDLNYQNHVFNIKAPPQGKFWREFLFNAADLKPDNSGKKFPVLKDSIFFCEVLWDDAGIKRSAIKEITKWINDVMDFDSKQERPHQPNRIYKLHLGRCGEHEDITAAAARSCLVPCRGIEAFSSDHVWNEFWDMEWQQWEPVNNSYRNKFCYSKGWGKKFGTVLCHESRGVFSSVTGDYCENTSDITIFALDAEDKPIDGAVIKLAVSGTLDETKIYIDTYGITDCEGKCTFKVESGHTYYARLESAIGNHPSEQNNVTQLPDKPEPGKQYSYKLKAAGKLPPVSFTEIVQMDSSSCEYRIEAEFECDGHFVNWNNIFDDLGGYTLLHKDNGTINFFGADSANFEKCKARTDFKAYNPQMNAQDGKAGINFTFTDPVILFFNNGTKLKNIVNVNAVVKLYVYDDVGVGSGQNHAGLTTVKVSPNPAESFASVEYNLQAPGNTVVEIVNGNGFIVKRFTTYQDAGSHSFVWDTADEAGSLVAGGLYMCRIRSGNSINTAKFTIAR